KEILPLKEGNKEGNIGMENAEVRMANDRFITLLKNEVYWLQIAKGCSKFKVQGLLIAMSHELRAVLKGEGLKLRNVNCEFCKS
ncbi:MAG: hypothetical protein NTX36_03200, partial [Proteobacteria bacterium]|nr:hypothetical protein [Pseudomonadota bacterium]